MEKPDNWAELTWQEKREKRFEWWRDARGVNFASEEARARHDARVDRIIKAIKLETPDRVPVDIAAGSYPAYYAGYDLKTIMYDSEKMKEAWLKFARDFDIDSLAGIGADSGAMMGYMRPRSNRWPGGTLADDASIIQFVEKEYMKFDEYEAYFENPADYILRTFLPRTYGVFEPLAKLPPVDSFMGIEYQLMMAAGSPEFREMAESLLHAHEESARWGKAAMELSAAIREMGFPAGGGMGGLAPFDTIADLLRGTHGSVMDMFRQPEKLHEMMERILPATVESAIRSGDMSNSPLMFIPMHKGDDMFMSDKQFETFYWPTYQRMLTAMIEEGLVPAPIVDGTYNRRLEYINDLPRTGVLWTFEKTDMALAKKVLGGHTCIAGNVTSAMMCTHEPEAIKKYCRWLIETCAPGSGYILSLGSSLAGKCRVENLHAIIDAAREYGVYK